MKKINRLVSVIVIAASTFFIIAKGHSMEKAGIGDEDLLVVDKLN